MSLRRWVGLLLTAFALWLAACGESGSPLAGALPPEGAIEGWTAIGEMQEFDTESLYDLVNGQADAFFAYAFERVVAQTYENAAGASLRVEVWQLGTLVDAYGLFSTYRAGVAVPVGNEGDADPGRRLDFWQNRYFVRLFAVSALEEATFEAFAKEISGALPLGGEWPALLDHLPQEGLLDRSEIFFRQEISVQNEIWLGGQNLLALGPETEAVLARYEIDGIGVMMLLVRYPDDEAALAALTALEGGGFGNLAAAGVQEDMLGAVFGSLTEESARMLLAKALEHR